MTKRPVLAGRGRRPPLAGRAKAGPAEIEAMIRVDHAGEFGALRIYEGQMAVLSETAPYSAKLLAIRRMAAQEQRHFEELDRMVRARAVRPTALEPVWRAAGYALGAATALFGEKAAMACTVAVEDVIDAHYRSQLDRLGGTDPELTDAIGRFHADECAHRDEAIAEGAREAPLYGAMTAAIRAGCRLAIALSERV